MIVLHPTYHPSFVQFLKEFNDTQDFFECHEVLEDYWKEVAPTQKMHPLAALILMSTAMYHWRRENFSGAIRTMRSSLQRIETMQHSSFFETINFGKLKNDMTTALKLMNSAFPFQVFSIQINDAELLTRVESLELPTSLDLHFLTHKHMLRDRSEILEEREKQKKRRDDQN